jgi:TolB-like protein
MKKTRILAILGIMGILGACVSYDARDYEDSDYGDTSSAPATNAPASAPAVSANTTRAVNLDAAIEQSSKAINDSLAQGTKVALLNFSSDSDVFSDYVLEEMSISLVNGKKLVVVDRREIDLIRGEMNFQMSGEVSDESAQEIGQKLGAQSIVSGSLVNLGQSYRFRTKVINVNSAAIEASSSVSVTNDSTF